MLIDAVITEGLQDMHHAYARENMHYLWTQNATHGVIYFV